MALTRDQTEELRSMMEERRRVLLAELQEGTERARADLREDLAGPAPDAGDESVATLIGDLDHADVSRDLAELRALDAARERMKEGSYGVCSDCGGEIDYPRLKAAPAALRCIRCQTLHEKTYASPSGSSL
ncbi:MAG TPA: TraR/DksA family transcriptional regulator [Burkholderiales bacterium]|nr:TraR/DksA family transcriptional regulator [Burkholderiales bacterium]